MVKKVLKKMGALCMSFLMILSVMPFGALQGSAQGAKSVERVKTDLDLSKLELYQFSLKQENMKVLSQNSSVEKRTVKANGSWKNATVFMMKIDKSKGKVDHKFTDPLKLKFTNAGTVNGKQVDVYVEINELRLDYQKNNGGGADNLFADPNRTAVPFLTVDENWGKKSIQIMD